jgi:transposase InsO family protein
MDKKSNRFSPEMRERAVRMMHGHRVPLVVGRYKVVRTTTSDTSAPTLMDLVNRQFKADRPKQLWVPDFTYVSTWQGRLYAAFVIDVYAHRIVGWWLSSSISTKSSRSTARLLG